MGRPSKYSQELADELCSHLAAGESMRRACERDGMPNRRTIFRWLRDYPEFCLQYEKAKAESADALVEEMLDIADLDDATESAQRSRLRVDTRKWCASKLKPKKYSDKVDVDLNGEVDINIVIGGDANS